MMDGWMDGWIDEWTGVREYLRAEICACKLEG